MDKKTVAAIALVLAALYALHRMRLRATPLYPASENTTHTIPSAEQWAEWWAFSSGGTPSTAGHNGDGVVTPGTITHWLGHFFQGLASTWSAPPAATNLEPQRSSATAGAFVYPGPVSPAQPTPQSAVQSSSPFLPSDFSLLTPVSAVPFATQLTLTDPFAALLVSNDFIDTKAIESSALSPQRA